MTEEKQQPYDKSSKWLIQHHGDSILRLAKIESIQAWRPAQAEVVQPRQLPDGLLEVRFHGETSATAFLLEVGTYPERRLAAQLTRDMLLVYMDRGELPEAIGLVLRPKGKYRVPRRQSFRSRRGLSSCSLSWRVVELWTLPAEQLLQAGDVGLIPWVPLTDFRDPPERVIGRCREVIELHAPAGEKANLLAVTQVFTRLRYNDPGLLVLLGGKEAMLESPLIEEVFHDALAEKARKTAHQDILTILETRFGSVPQEVVAGIRSVADGDRLTDLVRKAASCPDMESFRDTVRR